MMTKEELSLDCIVESILGEVCFHWETEDMEIGIHLTERGCLHVR